MAADRHCRIYLPAERPPVIDLLITLWTVLGTALAIAELAGAFGRD